MLCHAPVCLCIVHPGGTREAGVRNCLLLVLWESKEQYRTTVIRASFELFLYSSCSLGFYSGLTSLLFFSQSHQPFSTHFCTRLHQMHTLRRPIHHVLPVLHHPEASFPPPSNSILHRRSCVMHVSVTPEVLSVNAN